MTPAKQDAAAHCEACGLDHKYPNDPTICAAYLIKALRTLVAAVGMAGKCRGCNIDIFWVRHMNGKSVPYTPAGQNHFVDCLKAKEFKR
jgi:hypothetical protein